MPTHSIESLFNIAAPSPMHRVHVEWTKFNTDQHARYVQNASSNAAHQVELWCKRDDLLHPIISGNKWRKLVKPLTDFRQQPPEHVLSFGGPYSNHLHALAYCCHQLNVKFTAIVRGAYLSTQPLNPTLQDLNAWNANVIYVDKQTYHRKNDLDYLKQLRQQLTVDTIIPEGGSQQDALQGMQHMLKEVNLNQAEKSFDTIVIPVGSGASMAGIIEGADNNLANEILGIGVLNGVGYLEGLVAQFLDKSHHEKTYLPWRIEHNFHFGGYAKTSPELDAFCHSFNQHQQKIFKSDTKKDAKTDTPVCTPITLENEVKLPLRIEPVYSGKCFYAVKTLIQEGYFAPNSRILIVHTGGMQGAREQQHIIL